MPGRRRRFARADARRWPTQASLPPARALVIQRHRHLKWPALDWLEALLMILCGVCMFGFTMCVFFDVMTRDHWLPVAVAAAGHHWLLRLGRVRRHGGRHPPPRPHLPRRDHAAHDGTQAPAIETLNRMIVLVIAGFMVVFGFRTRCTISGSFRMPSLIPLTVYTAIVPMSGVLIACLRSNRSSTASERLRRA